MDTILLVIYANGKPFRYLHKGQDKNYIYIHPDKDIKSVLVGLKNRFPEVRFEAIPFCAMGEGNTLELIQLYEQINDAKMTDDQKYFLLSGFRMYGAISGRLNAHSENYSCHDIFTTSS